MRRIALVAASIAGLVAAVLSGFVLAAAPALAQDMKSSAMAAPDKVVTQLLMPIMNPVRGKKLFITKGCIACHAINGLGGHDAPSLDSHTMHRYMNPFEFAAKMWRGAAAMIAAQEGAFDEQIKFNGQELADIIGFAHDHEAQHSFTEADLTPEAREMMDHDHGDMTGHEAHPEETGNDQNGPGQGHAGEPAKMAAKMEPHPHAQGTPPDHHGDAKKEPHPHAQGTPPDHHGDAKQGSHPHAAGTPPHKD